MAILLDGECRAARPPTRPTSTTTRRSPGSARADEPLLLGDLTLAELDVLLQRELGLDATLALIRSVTGGGIRLIAPTDADLTRAAEHLEAAAEHRPRLADALLVATAERLGVRRIATFDRRPIAVFQPRHVRTFDLEP